MWTRNLRATLVAVIASATANADIVATDGDELKFSSGGRRVDLIELFTSEGCSSCPPADRWMSGLSDDPGLWKDFAPIALHVDYWDYIGWRDRYARPEFGARQRRYVEQGGARFVYTPGVFSNGREWQAWRRGAPVCDAVSTAPVLSVVVDGDDVAVEFRDARERRARLVGHVALLGMNLRSRVRAGENAGRTLRHDFVALGVASAPLEPKEGGYLAFARLPETRFKPAERALVVWVTEAGKQAAIQSAGTFLPGR